MAQYHRKDVYHQRAKREGFRSRAAYKLADIQRRERFLQHGARVVDLGCWPGGWLQVAARAVGAEGCVVGVDVRALDAPLDEMNVRFLEADLTDPDVATRVRAALGGPADVLLSDAAPKLTGIRDTDRAREEALLEAISGVPSLPESLASNALFAAQRIHDEGFGIRWEAVPGAM